MTTKKKSERLTPVRQLAEHREKDAALSMAASSQSYQSSLMQLEKLNQYREEYVNQFKLKGQQGISAARLVEFQAFVHKIDRAIEQQKQYVEKLQHDLGRKQQAYQHTHNRKKAVQKVIDKSRSQENRLAEQREQNIQDDRPRSGVTDHQ